MRALALTLLLACSACVAAPYPYYPYYSPYYAPYPSVAAQPPQQPDAARQNCHEFETTVMIEGQQQQARGTTCQQPDGTWKVE